jgi:hypothetical protein
MKNKIFVPLLLPLPHRLPNGAYGLLRTTEAMQ